MENHNPNKFENIQRLIAGLRWNARHAEESARIALSKAIWLGLEREEVFQAVQRNPSASYVLDHPYVLTEAWHSIEQAQTTEVIDDFDQLLSAVN